MIPEGLAARARELGVELAYEDVDRVVHDADPEVVAHVVDVLDGDQGEQRSGHRGPDRGDPVVDAVHVGRFPVVVRGRPVDVSLVVDGTRTALRADGNHVRLPADLPLGCHRLDVSSRTADGVVHDDTCTVVVAPVAMPGADTERSTGLFVPTYALWDEQRPLPEFGHLRRLASELGRLGIDTLATLPLYATFLDDPYDPSPYSPISRLHWNEVYLDDADLPEAPLPDDRQAASTEVDWRALATRRREQLLQAAADATPDLIERLDRFTAELPDVVSYAQFMAARTTSGEGAGDAIAARSHVLAQYLADRQLAGISAGGGASLALDLPIGSHPDGWETATHPDLFASAMAVGAPPDTFFTEGQNWGFPPPLPHSMRRRGYDHWQQMIARAGRHADMLRIDHVMAVHRLWWIPDGFPADRGVYVRYPHDELLAVIAASAATAGVAVVGENLGTVPPAVDAALDDWQMLGMYEEQFNVDGPALGDIPSRAVVGVRTHDMVPFAVALDETANPERVSAYRRMLRAGTQPRHATPDVAPPEGVPLPDPPLLDMVLERLAGSDAAVVVADLDDLLDETRPHNVPGRVLPGIWSRRLDRPLDATLADERVARRLKLLTRRSP